jgi:hypothetical protein
LVAQLGGLINTLTLDERDSSAQAARLVEEARTAIDQATADLAGAIGTGRELKRQEQALLQARRAVSLARQFVQQAHCAVEKSRQDRELLRQAREDNRRRLERIARRRPPAAE